MSEINAAEGSTPALETPVVAPTPTPTPAAVVSVDSPTPVDPTPTPAPTPAPVEEKPVAGVWPDDWRDKFAESIKPGDKAFRQRMERFTSPADVGKSWLALEAKQSAGELKRLPKDASPEEVQAWRKENGLPEKVEDYKPELPEGVVLGETDKTVLEGFQKFAFEQNLPPEVMNKTLGWYFAEQERVAEAQEIADATFHDTVKEELISEWGSKDYRANLAAMTSLRDQMPSGLADRILAGRTADGRLIGDDPQFLRWFTQLSRDASPAATLVSIGVDSAKNLSDQIDSIQKTMREEPAKYWKDPSMQERYRELLDARDKFSART